MKLKPFAGFTGLAAPLDMVSVDTDTIIPKQFLRSISRSGLGQNAFFDWRYLDGDATRPNGEFVLNRPRYQGAEVLVCGDNFGCGSSREHAAWALGDYGFRCLISTRFADIFYNNCIKNGILPALVAAADREAFMAQALSSAGERIAVDLQAQTLRGERSGHACGFRIEAPARESLLKGLDDLGLTMERMPAIRAFEQAHLDRNPWLPMQRRAP